MAIPTTWHEPASARSWWSAAPPDALLEVLLEVARQQIVEFAPALPIAEDDEDPTPIPSNYQLAQVYQARALWEANRANVSSDSDVMGGEYQVRVYPMSWNIKNILRPQPGVPVVR